MPRYKVRDGFSFRLDDETVVEGGHEIELEEEVASQHDHRLEKVDAETETGK